MSTDPLRTCAQTGYHNFVAGNAQPAVVARVVKGSPHASLEETSQSMGLLDALLDSFNTESYIILVSGVLSMLHSFLAIFSSVGEIFTNRGRGGRARCPADDDREAEVAEAFGAGQRVLVFVIS